METPLKENLIAELRESFTATTEWINKQPEENFNKVFDTGKWTIAGHLYHLIKSTKAVSQGMLIPRDALKANFGVNNREERTYEGMVEKYRKAMANADPNIPNPYQAEDGRTFERPALVARFEGELTDLIHALDSWEEAEMSQYIMPHPALGRCTVREFIYFTDLHTRHHLKILQLKNA